MPRTALTPLEMAALSSSARSVRTGLAIMLVTATLFTSAVVVLAIGEALARDPLLIAFAAFVALGATVEALKLKRTLKSHREAIAGGIKAVHRTRIERISLMGGLTNPSYLLTFREIGQLEFRSVKGLACPSLPALQAGDEVEVHLVGNPALFLRLTPIPSIERTYPGKPGHAAHVER